MAVAVDGAEAVAVAVAVAVDAAEAVAVAVAVDAAVVAAVAAAVTAVAPVAARRVLHWLYAHGVPLAACSKALQTVLMVACMVHHAHMSVDFIDSMPVSASTTMCTKIAVRQAKAGMTYLLHRRYYVVQASVCA